MASGALRPKTLALTAVLALALAFVLATALRAQDAPGGDPGPPEGAAPAPEQEGPEGAPMFAPAPGTDSNEVIITASDIEALKVSKLEDVLNQVSGVSASSSSVSVHGSSKVKVFLDGTPLNDPTSSYGAINFDHIPLSSIEKITIIRGAGGLRWGQDATAGVVLIQSKSFGKSKASGHIRVMGGNKSYDREDADLSFTSGAFGIGVRAGHEKNGGYKINNDSEKWSGGLKLGWNFGEKRAVNFAIDQIQEKSGLSGLPQFPTPQSRSDSDNLASSLSVEYDAFAASAYYNRGKVVSTDPSRNLHSSLIVAEQGVSLTWERKLPFGLLTLGSGYTQTDADSTDFGQKSEYTVHGFADMSVNFPSAHLAAKAGLRYNYNSSFENSLNPEFGLTYSKGAFEAAYKLSYGVNTPSFQQRYTHTSSTAPNESLGVEKALSQSLTLSWEARKNLSLSATLFNNNLTGRITYVREMNTGVGTYKNLGKALYRGFDLGADWKPIDEIEIKANFTHLIARDMDLKRFLTSQARNTSSLEVLANPFKNFTAAAKWTWQTKSFLDRDNTRTLPARSLYYLRAEYTAGSVTFFLNIDNLLDKEYYYIDGLLAPPRIWRVGMKWGF
jgi:iron complex outermembrane receptor protein